MIRKALIISNPGEIGDENYCEGVLKDVDNFKNYLQSPKGGGWYSNEILVNTKPSKTTLDSTLQILKEADYTFIVFCGHGYSRYGNTRLVLSKGNEIDADDLRYGATNKKRTIILDSCRKEEFPPEAIIEKAVAERRFTMDAQQNSRKVFDDILNLCSAGIVFINSCSYNETATDLDKYGGLYSYHLIKYARAINMQSNRYLSIVGAHNEASNIVKQKSVGNQNPEIEKPRSEPYFPFAV